MENDSLRLKKLYEESMKVLDVDNRKLGELTRFLSGDRPFTKERLEAEGLEDKSNENFRTFKTRVRRKVNAGLNLLRPTEPAELVTKYSFEHPTEVGEQLTNALSSVLNKLLLRYTHDRKRFFREGAMKGLSWFIFMNKDDLMPTFVPRGRVYGPPTATCDFDKLNYLFIPQTLSASFLFKLIQPENADNAKTLGWKPDKIRSGMESKLPQSAEFGFGEDGKFEALRKAVESGYVKHGDETREFSVLDVIYCFVRNMKTGKIEKYVMLDGSTWEIISHDQDFSDTFCDFACAYAYDDLEGDLFKNHGILHDIYASEWVRNTALNDAVDVCRNAKIVAKHKQGSMPVFGNSRSDKSPTPTVRVSDIITVPASVELDATLLGAIPSSSYALMTTLDRLSESTVNVTPLSNSGSVQPVSSREQRFISESTDDSFEAEADAFYEALDKVYGLIFKRLLTIDPETAITPDKKQKEFLKQANLAFTLVVGEEEKVVSQVKEKLLESLEAVAVRLFGNGSMARAKSQFNDVFPVRGSLPNSGSNNLIYDFMVAMLGSRRAERYAGGLKTRNAPTKDLHDARQESAFFALGIALPVAEDDPHEAHTLIHLNDAYGKVEQFESGELDLQALARYLQTCMPHLSRHVDLYASGASTEEMQNKKRSYIQSVQELGGLMRKTTSDAEAQRQAQAIAARREREELEQRIEKVSNDFLRTQQELFNVKAQREQDQRLHQMELEAVKQRASRV